MNIEFNQTNQKIMFVLVLLCLALSGMAQQDLEKELETIPQEREKVTATFKSGKLINLHTNETIHRNELDFKVDHRFGDIAGDNGGISQFFGLDNSTDIRIGFDYGVSDRLTAGLARAKGATAVQQLIELSLKFRLLQQTSDDRMPLSATAFVSNTIAAVKANKDDPTAATSYSSFTDRMNYVSQLILARKFSPGLSLILIPSYIHRNYTQFNDQNDLFALGAGGRLKLSKRMSLVVDYTVPFRNKEEKQYLETLNQTRFYNVLGAGLEMETGGHVFHFNFTNATAIQEMQFIPQTTSSWTKGQYRWGFSISRRFSFNKR
ncbi:DUF5777 family beta-barrel protein [Pedobacter faecalis]|uniref:DUF5777 family beta-barrel protein n=1 Tax=Pedobacter faecalis TaxID=3041495 RepID=UPI00254BED28|nr:DUF5777 family beta-barrel protein [Pedobacter sp. ELA7]